MTSLPGASYTVEHTNKHLSIPNTLPEASGASHPPFYLPLASMFPGGITVTCASKLALYASSQLIVPKNRAFGLWFASWSGIRKMCKCRHIETPTDVTH
jgi:hypothetical protein